MQLADFENVGVERPDLVLYGRNFVVERGRRVCAAREVVVAARRVEARHLVTPAIAPAVPIDRWERPQEKLLRFTYST